MNKSTKIGLICGAWALIGGFISTDFLSRFLSWNEWISFLIGSVVGGLGAYLSYEFEQVKIVCKNSFAEIFVECKQLSFPTKERLLVCAKESLLVGIFFAITFHYISLFLLLLCYDIVSLSIMFHLSFLIVPVVVFVVFSAMSFFNLFAGSLLRNQRTDIVSEEMRFLLKANPFNVYFYWILWRGLLRGIFFDFLYKIVFRNIPFVYRVLKNIVCDVFRQIHYDERVLCAVYTVSGILVGFLFEQSVIGGIFAFFFGKFVGVKVIRVKILGLNGDPLAH